MTAFFDTHVLLYADDTSGGPKTSVAQHLLREALPHRRAALSTQVLQVYFINATRKLGMTTGSARARVEILRKLNVVSPTPELVLAAIDLHNAHHASFWDALIIRAAQHAQCGVLYSEDLQHGCTFGSLQVVNPFR